MLIDLIYDLGKLSLLAVVKDISDDNNDFYGPISTNIKAY